MRKIISKLIVVTLILALIPITSAQQEVTGESYYGIATYRDTYENINFTDINNHWSKKSILKMSALSIIKGMGEGFYPDNNLTRDQAIALLVRLMGLETEAQKAGEETINNNDTGDYVILGHDDYWARGYIQVAQNQNILTQEEIDKIKTLTPEQEDDIEYTVEEQYEGYLDNENLTADQLDAIFQELQERIENRYSWQRPVNREQVAVWVYRVLKLQPIYGKNQHKIYTLNDYDKLDTKNIPAIEAILQKGIMNGDDRGNFNPNSPMTRGEMAKLLDNIHEGFLLDRGYKIGTGIVNKIDTTTKYKEGEEIEERVITISNEDNTLTNIIVEHSTKPLNNKGFVGLKNNDIVFPDGIDVQDYVRYFIDTENRVILLETIDRPELFVEGFIEEVDEESNTVTIMNYEDIYYLYKVSSGANIKINGQPATLKDLLYGLEVKLNINNGKITSIKGELDTGEDGYIPPGGRIYIGKVLEIDIQDGKLIVMEENERLELEISPYTSIIKDNDYIALNGIKEGDMVRLEFDSYKGSDPSKVYIASPDRQMENLIKAKLNRYNQSRQEVLLTDIYYFDYFGWGERQGDNKLSLSQNPDIYIRGNKIDKSSLNDYIGKELYIVTNNNFSQEEAVQMIVKDGYERKYYNKLQKITYGDNRLRVDYNNMYFDDSTIIVKNGRLIHPYNLKLSEELLVITQGENNNATFISVEAPTPMSTIVYKGEIDDIYQYGFDIKDYDVLENNKWKKTSYRSDMKISEDTSIIDTRWDEPVEISVETFNNSRFYTDENTKLGSDHEKDNFKGENVYVIEYNNMVSAIDVVEDFNGEEIITSAKVDSVDVNNNTISIVKVKDWSDFRQKWNINSSEFNLKVEDTIFIKNGKRATINDIAQDDDLYIIRKNNIGHIVIAE